MNHNAGRKQRGETAENGAERKCGEPPQLEVQAAADARSPDAVTPTGADFPGTGSDAAAAPERRGIQEQS